MNPSMAGVLLGVYTGVDYILCMQASRCFLISRVMQVEVLLSLNHATLQENGNLPWAYEFAVS
jgi:hypothetical protein